MKLMAASGLALVFLLTGTSVQAADDMAGWKAQAARITITRDNWGIAHVRGKTDADAVFGMIYAQAEDDFNRVETNYINAMGRLAEAEGESAVIQDLRMKLFIDPADLKARYETSPPWLKTLMTAWADGLNYYLATHPKVTPRVIKRFEPWMALSFSEGSIGGDIEKVSLAELGAFYGKPVQVALEDTGARFKEPTGSNGIAIARSKTAAGNALLLINPHTSFFFRSELQMTSDEGLNAYGAATWGQFFIYQGFNQNAGWMHTTSGLDAVDEFAETIVRRDGKLFYRYGAEERPVTVSTITVPYRGADGAMKRRDFTVYRTHHGPIVREADGKWIAISLMHRPVEALSQSFLRTKATDYASFLKVAQLAANSSNNTLFADKKGEIAYLHPQFIPKRDDRFDYIRPVDGADPATDWKGNHALADSPQVKDPATGWVFNTNNWPYTMAGPASPKKADFPRYMDSAGENPRGVHALRVLEGKSGFTIPTLLKAAYDPDLPAFETLIPTLTAAYDAAPEGPQKEKLKAPIEALRAWNFRWAADSVPTAVGVFFGETLWNEVGPDARKRGENIYDAMAKAPAERKLATLETAVDRLEKDFGTWKTPWGEINRFQRVSGDIVQRFDDAKPSIPVAFTSAQWGSLASFGSRRQEQTKRYYGTTGNSFVAIVEFGPKVKAVAVSAGGESGDPASPHFNDQAQRYADGNLRPVYFYPDDLKGHVTGVYKPGEPRP